MYLSVGNCNECSVSAWAYRDRVLLDVHTAEGMGNDAIKSTGLGCKRSNRPLS